MKPADYHHNKHKTKYANFSKLITEESQWSCLVINVIIN